MKIKVEKWIIDEDVSFKIVDIEKCCDKLINSKYVSVNNEYDGNDDKYTVKIHGKEFDNWNNDYYYNDYYSNDYYDVINFCPYCGSPINMKIINTIDKTKEYNAWRKERNILWDKCQTTDSKREEELLREQIQEIDEKTNKMLSSDDFGDYLNRVGD